MKIQIKKAKAQKKTIIYMKRYLPLYLMMLPGLIYLIINNYMPMGGIIIAFKKYNYAKGIFGSPFVGLKNFEFLFKTKEAWTITRNTLVYNLIFIILVQRILSNHHIDLPNCPSASLSSISVATATPHSSALHMEQLFYVNIAET